MHVEGMAADIVVFDPDTKTITEEVFPGVGVYPDLAFGSTPAESRVILSRVERVLDPPTPFLRYYAFSTGADPKPDVQLSTPLTVTSAREGSSLVPRSAEWRGVMVKIAFVAMPEGANPRDRDATTFYNDVYVRLANPTVPTQGPRCL